MNSMRLAFRFLSLASLLAASTSSATADTVRMRASVRIAPGADIALREVAELEGAHALSLADTVVAKGEDGAFEIGAERVRQLLVVAGADMRRIELEGNATVVRPMRGAVPAQAASETTREARATGNRMVDPARESGTGTALGLICEMVANAFGDDACGLQLEISEEQLRKIAPRAGFRYEIVRKTALRTARIEFEVIARDAAGDETRTRVRVVPRFEREVLVARTDARRGDKSSGDATVIEKRLLGLDDATHALSAHESSEATFTRSVPAGAVIERGDLARAAEIKRRDRVMVRREVGMVAIEFEATALEDGAAGDIIALERTDRRKSRDARALSGEVVGPGRVVIR